MKIEDVYCQVCGEKAKQNRWNKKVLSQTCDCTAWMMENQKIGLLRAIHKEIMKKRK